MWWLANVMAEQMALESYDVPRRWKTYARLSLPWIKHMWTDEVLKPKAEMRAAKLRAQRGFTSFVAPASGPPCGGTECPVRSRVRGSPARVCACAGVSQGRISTIS